MYQQLYPTYTLRVEIKDGQPLVQQIQGQQLTAAQAIPLTIPGRLPGGKFYSTERTGCDDVLTAVRDALKAAGITNVDVRLDKFEHR